MIVSMTMSGARRHLVSWSQVRDCWLGSLVQNFVGRCIFTHVVNSAAVSSGRREANLCMCELEFTNSGAGGVLLLASYLVRSASMKLF